MKKTRARSLSVTATLALLASAGAVTVAAAPALADPLPSGCTSWDDCEYELDGSGGVTSDTLTLPDGATDVYVYAQGGRGGAVINAGGTTRNDISGRAAGVDGTLLPSVAVGGGEFALFTGPQGGDTANTSGATGGLGAGDGGDRPGLVSNGPGTWGLGGPGGGSGSFVYFDSGGGQQLLLVAGGGGGSQFKRGGNDAQPGGDAGLLGGSSGAGVGEVAPNGGGGGASSGTSAPGSGGHAGSGAGQEDGTAGQAGSIVPTISGTTGSYTIGFSAPTSGDGGDGGYNPTTNLGGLAGAGGGGGYVGGGGGGGGGINGGTGVGYNGASAAGGASWADATRLGTTPYSSLKSATDPEFENGKIKITYKIGGAKVTPAAVNAKDGVQTTLTAGLDCYADALSTPAGTVQFKNGNTVLATATVSAGDTSASANWTPSSAGSFTMTADYTPNSPTAAQCYGVGTGTAAVTVDAKPIVTFDAAGGTPVPPAANVTYGTAATEPTTDPSKVGHTFDEWQFGGSAFNFSTPITGDITLTATYTVNNYQVTFDSDGGTSVSPETVAYGANVPAPSVSKTGHTLDGWYVQPADTVEWNFGSDTMGPADMDLKAHWNINQYTATFDSAGGTAVAPEMANYNTPFAEPNPPTKSGFEFRGWRTSLGDTYDFSTPATGNIALTADWEAYTAPVFTSDDTATLNAGATLSFLVEADGVPAPTITASGLPAWATIVDNGDGTATISGTPSGSDAGETQVTITATNLTASVNQTLTLTVNDREAVPTALPQFDRALIGVPQVTQHGNEISLNVDGFEPNTLVEFVAYSSPTSLGTVRVGADGTATLRFSVPSSLDLGVHHIVAIGIGQDGERLVLGAVTEVTSTVEKKKLVITGTETGAMPFALGAFAAMVAGGLFARRRRL